MTPQRREQIDEAHLKEIDRAIDIYFSGLLSLAKSQTEAYAIERKRKSAIRLRDTFLLFLFRKK